MIPGAVPAVPEATSRADATPPGPAPPPAAAPSAGYDFSPLPAAPARAGGGGFRTGGEGPTTHGGFAEANATVTAPVVSSFPADASAGDRAERPRVRTETAVAGASFPERAPGGSFAAYSAAGSNFAVGDAGTPRSPHGRPPCAAASFGFGGRLAVSAPGYPGGGAPGGSGAGAGLAGAAPSAAPPGHVRVHSLAGLLRASAPGAAYLDALGAETLILETTTERKDRGRETFPPLIGRNPSAQSLARFAEARAAAATSAASGEDRSGAALLWRVLRAMSARAGPLAGDADGLSDPAGGDPRGPGDDVRALLVGEGVASAPVPSGAEAASASSAEGRDLALAESERLLLSGRRGDALEVLANAGLWAPATLLATRMGPAFRKDVATRAARATTAAGSPLRTLALVLAGAAPELARGDSPGAASAEFGGPGPGSDARDDARALLPRWREHLAVLAANAPLAPEDSRRVMAALGDALLAAAREAPPTESVPRAATSSSSFADAVSNAHAAFALAGVAPQPFHPAARLCLLGADHARFPRTYHSDPRAVQATALLERAVCSGSGSGSATATATAERARRGAPSEPPRVCFAAFQPYKVHYAGLLAEAGATREALALVESVSRTLRAREFLASADARDGSLDAPRLARLAGEMEHRLRGNARGTLGGLSLRDLGGAATTLFGGFGKMLDKGVQRVFGDEGNGDARGGGGGGGGERTGVVGRLVSHSRAHSGASSASRDSRDTRDVAQAQTHAAPHGDRGDDMLGSVAFSRGASFASDASASASGAPGGSEPGASTSGASSRGSGSVWRQFSGVLGKVGAAIPLPKPKNQAKLGEENTMRYDETLGRWVEPGKEGEADAEPPPPPPTALGASFAAGTGSSAPGSGHPAAATPAFSMRAQKGRSKYVDTFSLSAPVASERVAATAAMNPPEAGSASGQRSAFPAGLMPPGVGVSPGLFPPGVPGTFPGGSAPSEGTPPAMLMVPSPARAGADGLGEDGAADLVPLAPSPAPGGASDDAPSPWTGGDDAPTAPTAPTDPREPSCPVRSRRRDIDPLNREGALARPRDEDPEASMSFPSGPLPVESPPVAPMNDLRLADPPDQPRGPGVDDRARAPSDGDGRAADPAPARVALGGGGADVADDAAESELSEIDGRRDERNGRSAVTRDPDDPESRETGADSPGGEGAARASDAAPRGYFDREGVWRLGDWPGGERGADGRWYEGYWTQERFWVAGYWDETGAWREGARPGGHFDADTGWVADSADSAGFRVDRPTLGSSDAVAGTTTSAADVADALENVAGLGFGGGGRDDDVDEMTEIGL